jgi:CRP/FNR family transcriptional regulator, cyclic AMP receptor protein
MLLTKKLPAGALIFSEGSPDKTMYIVMEGSVKLFVTHYGNEVELAVIHKNEFFGEIEMFHNKPRSSSAKAITNVRLIYIKNRMQLDQFIAQYPEFSGKMIRMMGERLANVSASLL